MKSITKNFIYNALYQLVAIIVPLITTPYVSRVLGAENVGTVSYYHTMASYFLMLAMLGINNYGNRTIAREKENKTRCSELFSEIFSLQIILTVLSMVVYVILVFTMVDNPRIAILEGLYVVSAFLDISWLFFGLEDFKVTALRSSLIKILSTITIFIFVKSTKNIAQYIIICDGMYIVSNLVLFPRLSKHGVHFVKRSIKDIFSHFKGVCILFLPLLGVSLYKYMDKLMLGMMTSKIEVGLYESSEKINNVPVSFVAALGTVMLPRISNLMAKGEKDSCNKYMEYSISIAVFLSVSMAFGISAIVDDFVPVFYGPGYDKCASLIPILMLATVFLAIGNVTRTQFLIPGNYDSIFIGSIFSGAIVNIVLNTLLIPKWQSVGAAIATVLAELTVSLFQVLFVAKFVPIWKYLLKGIPFIIISLIMFMVVTTFHPNSNHIILNLMCRIFVGVLVEGLLVAGYIIVIYRDRLKKIFNN
jgi:O-antigen/teichoic acid export membrane protein